MSQTGFEVRRRIAEVGLSLRAGWHVIFSELHSNMLGISALRFWWMKRRVRGGVRDGVSESVVLERLGTPAEIVSSDEGLTWRYRLGSAGDYDYSYEVILADGHVRASVWRSSLRRGIGA